MTDGMGFLGLAFMLVSVVLRTLALCGVSSRILMGTGILLGTALLVPWKEHSVLFYLRGVTGDLSIATFCIVSFQLLHLVTKGRHGLPMFPWQLALGIVCLLSVLYLSTFGYIGYDLYAWGYHPTWMLPAVAGLMLWAWRSCPDLAWAWLIAAICFAGGITPGNNLWDALFDPFMLFGCIGVLLGQLIRIAISPFLKRKTGNLLVPQSLDRVQSGSPA